MTQVVRTRFAPSPTGFLHVGSARTAFWAYLLAKRHGGQFILRIEDTDQGRKVDGAVRSLLQEFAWFGITPDEGPSHEELRIMGEDPTGLPEMGGASGPYTQSQRLPRYKETAELLIEKGFAYRCDCTSEMLEQERLEQMARRETPGYSGYCRTRNVSKDVSHVIRLKIPTKKQVTLHDPIKGIVQWDNMSLRDPVLLKSDGFPTYHLAVVVDDHDMKISHVLRGDEWLSTAPIHVMLYEFLEWDPPVFAHLPVIMGPNGKKLSKREGSVFTSNFRDQGYLEEALLNFTVLIGWAPGDGEEQEIFTREELVQRFSLERCNSASGKFDYEKLAWMNGEYIRKLPLEEFSAYAKIFCEKVGISFDAKIFAHIAPQVQERVRLLTEIPPLVDFLFVDEISRDLEAMYIKGIDRTIAGKIIDEALVGLAPLNEFNHGTIEPVLRGIADKNNLKAGPAFGVIRIAVTGKKIAPPLFETLVALGKEKSLLRLNQTKQLL